MCFMRHVELNSVSFTLPPRLLHLLHQWASFSFVFLLLTVESSRGKQCLFLFGCVMIDFPFCRNSAFIFPEEICSKEYM